MAIYNLISRAQQVADWRIAVDERLRAGTVRRELKWEHSRDLLRGGVFSEKKAEVTIQAASRFLFLGSWQEVRRVYGVHIKPVIGRGDL